MTTTSPDLVALLLACRDEDFEAWWCGSRLVLADWLEEQGDDRAAAIRDLEVYAWAALGAGAITVHELRLELHGARAIDVGLTDMVKGPWPKRTLAWRSTVAQGAPRLMALNASPGPLLVHDSTLRVIPLSRLPGWTLQWEASTRDRDPPGEYMRDQGKLGHDDAVAQTRERVLELFDEVALPLAQKAARL
jgi:hypothetical protein